jgi:hypothetical protein
MVCNAQSYVSNKINMCRNVLCKPQEEEEEENDVASTPIVYCLFSPSLLCLIREGQVIFLRLLHKHASHRSKCRLCSSSVCRARFARIVAQAGSVLGSSEEPAAATDGLAGEP